MKDVSGWDLNRLFLELGIRGGDLVMVHSFLGKLGRLVQGSDSIIDALLGILGDKGAVIFPAYTYSYFENNIYDVENSKSTVGILGDLARKYPGSVRSLDPCFSMVAIGKKAKHLMKREKKNSFGLGSIYQKLLEENFKALLLGVDFTALSLFMHIEKLLNVPYRYDKEFLGTSVWKAETWRDSQIHFVKDLNFGFRTNRSKIGSILKQDGNCKEAWLGYSNHYCMESQRIFDTVKSQYANDKYCLIDKIN